MACPFARFSRSFGSMMDSSDSGASSSSSSDDEGGSADAVNLTTLLKDGTSEAHREIEKSVGVRALMGFSHSSSSSSSSSTMPLHRIDHLRFLIMLASIYITMEAIISHNKTSIDDMLPLLFRSKSILQDIQVHLDEILDSANSSISQLDIVEAEEDSGEEVKVHRESIFEKVQAAQDYLVENGMMPLSGSSPTSSSSISSPKHLSRTHIDLLTKRQAIAVEGYMSAMLQLQNAEKEEEDSGLHKDEGCSFTPLASPDRIDAATPSHRVGLDSKSGTSSSSFFSTTTRPSSHSHSAHQIILAHAYVRYMGDLSGGQHIVKRLSKLFPIYSHHSDQSTKVEDDGVSTSGFAFYSFTASSKGKSSGELKTMIRERLDGLHLSKQERSKMVDEASLAFRLNRKILDSLVDEQDEITAESSASSQFHHHHHMVMMTTTKGSFIAYPLMFAQRISPSTIYHPHSLALMAALLAIASSFLVYSSVSTSS